MLDPRSSQLGSTTDQKETKHNIEKVFIDLPLELGCVTCTGIIDTCKLVLEVICESRGLSNLTPSRSRLFKLKGRKGGSEVELRQALAYMVANLRKREREEKQSTVEKLITIKK